MLWLLQVLACGPSGGPCGDETVCETDDGYYLAAPPEDWDGVTPLPVVIEFHGYNGTPEKILARDDHRQGWSDSEVLWVQPAGTDGSWNLVGPGLLGRDEVAFARQVLDDVRSRWPVDETRLYLAGFSIGAGVADAVACDDTTAWAGIFSLSGGFFEPVPESCVGPPVPVLHLHGTADTTWPVEGDDFLFGWGQAGMDANLDLWRGHDGCDLPVPSPDDAWECQVQVCDDGSAIRSCLHPRGHTRPDGWNTVGFAWLAEHTR